MRPGRPWYLTGVAGVISAFLIMAFYTDVADWVLNKQLVAGELANGGSGGRRLVRLFVFLVRFVVPLAITLVLLTGFNIIHF